MFFRNKEESSEKISTLKSSIACPPHLVRILEKQTGLTEPQIHVRYMTFRHQYPTGFVGPHVLRILCLDVLNEKDCEEYVDRVSTKPASPPAKRATVNSDPGYA